MTKKVVYTLVFILSAVMVVFLTSCSGVKTAKAEHIIIIGVDGMSPDGILNASTPNIDEMIKNGAATFHGRAVRPSSSSSNWASMIMGAAPMHHGITSNSWERDNYLIEPADTGTEAIFPTIFSLIKSQKPELKTASVYDWSGFGRLYEKSAVDFDFDPEGPEATTEKAMEVFGKEKPAFLFIHLDHVDHAGHHDGHGTPEYYKSVERADSLIGAIYNMVKNSEEADNTIIMITSDHGGINKGHGGDTMAEMEIPFIITGPGVIKNAQITATYYTYDLAATSAYILGLEIPQSWVGRPAYAAFSDSGERYKKMHKEFVYEPVIKTKGGMYAGEVPEIVILNKNSEGKLHYTLDGSTPDKNSPVYDKPFLPETSMVLKAAVVKGNYMSNIVKADYTILDKNNGIDYKYFEGNWKKLPDFSKMGAVNKGRVYKLNVEEVPDKRDDGYGIVFTARLKIDQLGDYTFATVSDDGSKLYLNGKLVVDNDGSHGSQTREGNITLEKGFADLKIEYFEDNSGEFLKVMYKTPEGGMEEIPAERYFIK